MMGGDAEIGFTATVDADAAANELKAEFTKAIAEAMKSPALEQAMRRMALSVGVTLKKSIGDAMSGRGRGGGDPFKPLVTSADRAAKKIGDRFEKVARDAARSFDRFSGPGSSGLRGMTAQVEAIARSFDDLRTATEGQIRAMESMERLARQNADVQARLNRDLASSEQQSARERLVADQTATARALSNARRRLEIFRQVAAQVRFIERQIGVAFQRGAEVATRALRGIGRVVESLARTVGTRLSNIFSRGGGATSSGSDGLTRSLRQREREMQRSFDRQEQIMRRSASEQSAILNRINRQQERGIAGLVSGRSNLANALGIGGLLAGGAGITGLIRGGFERFSNVERLNLQFEALLGNAQETEALMADLDAFARTTRFDLVGIADLAKGFLTIGTTVDDILPSVTTLADAIAFTGGSTAQLNSVQSALQKIFSTGKLQGDEFDILAENLGGLNIRQLVADQMGISVQDLTKLQQAGKLDAQTFIDAFLTGLAEDPRIAGAAVALGGTLAGRLENLKEGFETLFATIIGLVAGPLTAVFSALNDMLEPVGNFISGEDLTKRAEQLRDILGDIIKGLGGALAIKAFGEALRFVGVALRALLTPMGLVVLAVTALSAFWGRLMDASEPLRESVEGLREAFGGLFGAIGGLLSGAFGRLFEAISGGEDGLSSIGDAVSGVVDKVADGIDKVTEWLNLLRDALGLPSGDATAPGGGRFSANNPFAAIPGVGGPDFAAPLSNLFGEGVRDDILIPISELPAEAQAVFAEKFADVEWVSPQDAARIWEQFSPDAQNLSEAVAPTDAAVNKARQAVLKKVSDLFGLDDTQFLTAMSGGGNRLLNILEQTWLGPVIGFFRGPFANGIETAYGFITGTILPALSTAFSAVSGFVTGTIIPGVRTAIDFFRNDFIPLMSDIWDEVSTFFEPAFKAVSDAISTAWSVIQPIIQPFIDGVTELVNMIRELDFSDLDLGNVAVGGAIGAGAGLLLGGPIGALLGGGIGALTQTPVFSGLMESIDNAWGLIQPKLEELWASLTGWLASHFTAEKLQGYTIGFFNFLRNMGKQIGSIASSPEFIAGIAGLGAAAIAIIGAFTIGLVQGVATNIDEWASIISAGLNAAWAAITGQLDFIPEPIANAISALIDNPVIGTAALLLGAGVAATLVSAIGGAILGRGKGGGAGGGFSFGKLASGIAGGLLSALTTAFTQTFRGGANLVKMIFGGDVSSTILSRGADGRLQGVGTAIASSIVAGIGAFTLGNVAGKSGSIGNVLLSILGGAGAGAAIGTAILPGIGTVVGAGLGAALAGIGAAIGASGAAAKKAADEVSEYSEALAGIRSAADQAIAGAGIVLDNLATEDENVQQLFLAAGFNAEEFFLRIARGTSDATTEVANLFQGLADNADSVDLSGALDIFQDRTGGDPATQLARFSDGLQGISNVILGMGGGADSLGDIRDEIDRLLEGGGLGSEMTAQLQSARSALNALEDAGFDVGDALDFLGDEGREGMEGLDDAIRRLKFTDVIEGVQTVEEAVAGLLDGLGDGQTATQLNELLNQTGLGTEDRLTAINDALETTRDAVDQTRDALADLVSGSILGDDPEALRRRFALSIPDIGDQLDQLGATDSEGVPVIPVELQPFQREEILAGLRNDIDAALTAGVRDGSITSQAELLAAFSDLEATVDLAGLSPEARQAILDEFSEIELRLGAIDPASFDALAEAIANNDTLTAAAILAGTNIGTAMGSAAVAAYAAIAAAPQNFSFNQASLTEDTRFGGARQTSGSSNQLQTQLDGMANSLDYSGITKVGEKIPTEVNTGIGNNAGEIDRGVQDALTSSAAQGNTAALAFIGTGTAMITAMSTGVVASSGSLAAAIGRAVGQAGATARVASVIMFGVGANLTLAMASGIRSQVGAVATAAAVVAAAAAAAARSNLKIASPSKVFVDIGKQVGDGFAKGISDSETTMTDAISTALTEAIDKATNKVGRAVATARAGEEIFNALAPSRLPGGTSTADELLSALELRTGAFERSREFRGSFSERLGEAGGGARLDAVVGANQAGLNLNQHLAAMRDEVKAAADANKALYNYDQTLKNLNTSRTRGTFGQIVYREQLQELNEQLALGSITQKKYNQDLKELNAALKSGKLNTDEFNRKLKELGDRPDPLSFRQLEIRRNPGGAASLNTATFLGAENVKAIQDALEAVRTFGQEAASAGTPLTSVISSMNTYIANLRKQAVANGISAAGFDSIVAQLGLTSAKLNELKNGLTSLDISTESGALNIQKFLGELQGIREFGSALVGTGVSADAAVAQMKAFRNQFLAQATAFGFSGANLAKLVEQVGLSDSALAEFVKQMREFEKAAKAAAAAQEPTTSAPGPTVGELNIYTPYGDPEAIGQTVANRLAYRLPRR